MSGGHYEGYYQIGMLCDEIEREFINDGKYMGEDWSRTPEFGFYSIEKRSVIEYDRLGDATPEERLKILAEIKSLVHDLRRCAKRAKELDWYMSGDTGATTFLDRLKE